MLPSNQSIAAQDVTLPKSNTVALGGPPSPRIILTVHFINEILRRSFGDVAAFPFNDVEIIQDLEESPKGARLLYFDVPNRIASDYLLKAPDLKLLMVNDDFNATVEYCMRARKMGVVEACRFVSQSFCCLEPFRLSDSTINVDFVDDMPLAEWILRLVDLVALAPPRWDQACRIMLDDYARYTDTRSARIELVRPADTIAGEEVPCESDRQLIDALAAGYGKDSLAEFFWPARLLLSGVAPYPSVEGKIELLGPARVLTFGPYMHLPVGSWHAEYRFETWENDVGNVFSFDVYADGEIKFSDRIALTEGGMFAVKCEFDIANADSPVEFRCFLDEGTIGGYFLPLGVHLVRQ